MDLRRRCLFVLLATRGPAEAAASLTSDRAATAAAHAIDVARSSLRAAWHEYDHPSRVAARSTTVKNAGVGLLFIAASGVLLAACAASPPPGIASKAANGAPARSVVATRYSDTRRVTQDGVEYFCERPRPTGSQFIQPREQCYTEAQLKAVRERDQDFVRRQQSIALQTNTTSVTRTAISP